MTINVTVDLYCDGCEVALDDTGITAEEVRAFAEQEGWQPNGDGRDLCPECLPVTSTRH